MHAFLERSAGAGTNAENQRSAEGYLPVGIVRVRPRAGEAPVARAGGRQAGTRGRETWWRGAYFFRAFLDLVRARFPLRGDFFLAAALRPARYPAR